MAGTTYTLTIDRTPHQSKPKGAEIGAITRRLQAAGPEAVSYEELERIILTGGTICCGCYQPTQSKWGEFVGMQLFALDFDNPDVLDPMDALGRCEEMNLPPLMMYFTFSATVEPWYPKYRLLFDAGELIADKHECECFLITLLEVFPEADQACKNLNRLYFGGSEAIRLDTADWMR